MLISHGENNSIISHRRRVVLTKRCSYAGYLGRLFSKCFFGTDILPHTAQSNLPHLSFRRTLSLCGCAAKHFTMPLAYRLSIIDE